MTPLEGAVSLEWKVIRRIFDGVFVVWYFWVAG